MSGAPLHVLTSTISRFGERFRDGQYSFLFAALLVTVPPCPAICKSGGMCPHPRTLYMESALLSGWYLLALVSSLALKFPTNEWV